MTTAFPPNHRIRVAPGYRLQWEEAQEGYVLLYPEGMIKLNPAASEILKRCDGSRTIEDIIADLKQHFPDAELAPDVLAFIEVARDKRWICAA